MLCATHLPGVTSSDHIGLCKWILSLSLVSLFLDQVGKGALSTVVAIEMHGHEDTLVGGKILQRRTATLHDWWSNVMWSLDKFVVTCPYLGWQEEVNALLHKVCLGKSANTYKIKNNIDHVIILLMEEILHQLIGSVSHYLKGCIHPNWCGISPINSRTHCDTVWRTWSTLVLRALSAESRDLVVGIDFVEFPGTMFATGSTAGTIWRNTWDTHRQAVGSRACMQTWLLCRQIFWMDLILWIQARYINKYIYYM